MSAHLAKLFFVAALMVGAAAPAVTAGPLSSLDSAEVRADDRAAAPLLLAQGWSLGRWFSGVSGRTRVVQFCVVTMCIALFIMMRKFRV